MDSSRTQTRSSPLTVSSVDTPMVCAGEYVRTLGLLSFAHGKAGGPVRASADPPLVTGVTQCHVSKLEVLHVPYAHPRV